jgi:hypothetical protein
MELVARGCWLLERDEHRTPKLILSIPWNWLNMGWIGAGLQLIQQHVAESMVRRQGSRNMGWIGAGLQFIQQGSWFGDIDQASTHLLWRRRAFSSFSSVWQNPWLGGRDQASAH